MTTTKWKENIIEHDGSHEHEQVPPQKGGTRPTRKKVPNKINLPPLQSVFEIPSSHEPFTTSEPLIEGLDTDEVEKAMNSATKTVVTVEKQLRDAFDYSNYAFYQWLYGEIQTQAGTNDPAIVGNDTNIVYTFIVFSVILPVIVYASYNWYYLLAYCPTIEKDVQLDISFLTDPQKYSGFVFEFVAKPLELLDWFIFTYVTKFFQNPLQTFNLYFTIFVVTCFILFCYLPTLVPISWVLTFATWFLAFSHLVLSGQFALAVLAFVLFFAVTVLVNLFVSVEETVFKLLDNSVWLTVIVWGYFSMWVVSNPFRIFSILVRGFLTYYLSSFSMIFIYIYLVFFSFFGYSFNENELTDFDKLDKFMLDVDKQLTDSNPSSLMYKFYFMLSKYFLNGWKNVLCVIYILFFFFFLVFVIMGQVLTSTIVNRMTLAVLALIFSFGGILVFLFQTKMSQTGGTTAEPSEPTAEPSDPMAEPSEPMAAEPSETTAEQTEPMAAEPSETTAEPSETTAEPSEPMAEQRKEQIGGNITLKSLMTETLV